MYIYIEKRKIDVSSWKCFCHRLFLLLALVFSSSADSECSKDNSLRFIGMQTHFRCSVYFFQYGVIRIVPHRLMNESSVILATFSFPSCDVAGINTSLRTPAWFALLQFVYEIVQVPVSSLLRIFPAAHNRILLFCSTKIVCQRRNHNSQYHSRCATNVSLDFLEQI